MEQIQRTVTSYFHGILAILLAITACTKTGGDSSLMEPVYIPQPGNINPPDTTQTYLALGDSYTIGQSVPEQARFPAQTVALLRQSNIPIRTPVYVAATGWTTLNLMDAIKSAQLLPSYDVVSLLIGVNDQYQLRDTTNYRQRFTALLNKAISLAKNNSKRVFVLSIPDYSVTPFVPAQNKEAVSRQIDLFNAINKQVAEQYQVSYTDITPGSREGATNPSLIANDQLHPSGSEYAKWAALLAPKIKQVLQ